MKITVPVEVMMEEVRRVLEQGGETTIRAKGRSMMPYVRDGKDDLVLRAIEPERLRVGDFVLARTIDKRYVAHRIISIDGEGITLKGDGNLQGTERCRPEDVLGIVTHVVRDGRRIDCNTEAERRKAARGRRWYHCYLRVRRLGGAVLRRLGLRK